LYIYIGTNVFRTYKIIELTTNELVVYSPSNGWGVDTLSFKASVDQKTKVEP
jgi:hypothetical protein